MDTVKARCAATDGTPLEPWMSRDATEGQEEAMSGKKRSKRKSAGGSSGRDRRRAASPDASGTSAPPEDVSLGDVAREELNELAEYHGTSPVLTGGDIDADWQRAAASGEEAVGGTVSTPDQDRVDDLGKAVGVERSPDAPFRASSEILDERDQRRPHQAE
jgi:uncharacterized protein DUF6335